VVESRILAPLRNHVFFSPAELNLAIRPLAEDLNSRPFQKLGGSRRSLFEELDKPALKPLPAQRYEFAEWKKARVNIDYHIDVEHNFYSVPYALVHKEVEVRLTLTTLEAFFRGHRVASHARSYGRGHYSTLSEHMPEAHRKQRDRNPAWFISEAESIGPETGRLVEAILQSRPHPEQGYRACLGVIRLGRRYPKERMEAAARRANRSGVRSYKRLKSILDHGLDRVSLEPRPDTPPAAHPNVRGPHYFGEEATSC